jgi:hypothetical protein
MFVQTHQSWRPGPAPKGLFSSLLLIFILLKDVYYLFYLSTARDRNLSINICKEISMADEKKPLSRSEREAQIKDKAGWVITVLAALLAVNTYVSNGLSSKVLTNTIAANNMYSFYQAKSIKQTLAEQSLDDAVVRKETAKIEKLEAKIARYESDPKTGEGKKELLEKARALEAERDVARKHGPWLTFSGTGFQLAIVLLTASILAVSMPMFWGSLGVGAVAVLLMGQGCWLWLPF